MTTFCITYAGLNQYTKNEQVITLVEIQYFDPATRIAQTIERGYTCMSRNVYPDFTLEDFPQIPGYYNLEFRQRPGFRGKAESKLINAALVKPLSIKSQINSQSYLILNTKKIDYMPEGATRKVKGTKCLYIDPANPMDSEDERGFPMIDTFSSRLSIDSFPECPGYYLLAFKETRGKYGRATSFLETAEFLGEMNSEEKAA